MPPLTLQEQLELERLRKAALAAANARIPGRAMGHAVMGSIRAGNDFVDDSVGTYVPPLDHWPDENVPMPINGPAANQWMSARFSEDDARQAVIEQQRARLRRLGLLP